MVKGALIFIVGFAAGVAGMGWGTAKSMGDDPGWWYRKLMQIRAERAGSTNGQSPAPAPVERAAAYDPTRFRAGGRSDS